MQIQLTEFPLKEFKCPVSKEIHKDIYNHNKNCIYRYCKYGWMWTKGLIDSQV